MATPFAFPVTAAQIGTYFVGQYYHLLQQQPDYVHQFYTDASTMLRIDGNTRETATAMLQIHSLIMSLSYTGIEIRTVHALESWNGGVLVMVSGAVQLKDYSRRKKFMQTFFLAPQEKGFFVLNDVFHYIEDDQILHHPANLMVQNVVPSLNSHVTNSEQVPNYVRSAETQNRNLSNSAVAQENGSADAYNFSEQRLQHGAEQENNTDHNSVKATNNLHSVQDPPAPLPPAEESLGEPQKHTYASILRVAKGQSAPSASPQSSLIQNNQSASEWQHSPQSTAQLSSSTAQSSLGDTADETPLTVEGEIKSVYVRNLPFNVSTSEIEEQFGIFGKIKPDGVVIRSRKDVGFCYAFVEFEDMSGVENAVKASTAQVAGRQVYIEERRANSNIPSQGGRRGRGRGGYQTEAPRGRFGSRFGRGGAQDSGDRGHRQRGNGNGFYRQVPRQERDFTGHQASRNGHNPSEEAVAALMLGDL